MHRPCADAEAKAQASVAPTRRGEGGKNKKCRVTMITKEAQRTRRGPLEKRCVLSGCATAIALAHAVVVGLVTCIEFFQACAFPQNVGGAALRSESRKSVIIGISQSVRCIIPMWVVPGIMAMRDFGRP